MAVNQKSATLPANLRHAATTDNKDSGSFFSRLKKRFRLRKGNYDIGVNTGECENISAVSFRKRESQEGLTDELSSSPNTKHKKLSPLGKRPHRSHSDTVSPEKLKIKTSISPKQMNIEHLNNDSKPSKTGDLKNEPKRGGSLKYEVVKPNEYSMIQFENDPKVRKPLNLDSEGVVKNDCITVDDSAVDLDDGTIAEPGYESLNDVKQRIESKDFSFSRKDDTKEQANISKNECTVHQNSKTALDDSALSFSLAETNIHLDKLRNSSKSRDSDFESSKAQNSPENLPSIVGNTINKSVICDDDDEEELRLDPGYAECADAIKGTLPFGAYSDGSGSKLSSCQSLDGKIDDIEPDYAECVDALKSGSVKMRISVSNERLADKGKAKSNEHIQAQSGAELYANPQILLKKRSRVLTNDRSSGEFSNRSSEADRNESFTFSSSESLQKDIKEDQSSSQAPPLPARNYSLYLENEEVDKILVDEKSYAANSVDETGCHIDTGKMDLSQIDDSAFEDFGYSSLTEAKRDTIARVGESSGLNHSPDNYRYVSSQNKEQYGDSSENKEKYGDKNVNCSIKYTKASETVEIDNLGGYSSVKESVAAKQQEECNVSQRKEISEFKETSLNGASAKDTNTVSFKPYDEHRSAEIGPFYSANNDDFGYASVKEVSNKDKQCSVELKEPVVINSGLNKLGEDAMLDFGYASVNEVSKKSTAMTSSKEIHPAPDSMLPSSLEDDMIDAYASVKDTKRKHFSDLDESKMNSLPFVNEELHFVSDQSNIQDSNLINGNSLEIQKINYVKSLEDNFGYTSVNDIKKQKGALSVTETSESLGLKTENESCSTEIIKQNLDDFGYSSVKECDKTSQKATEEKAESRGIEDKLNLMLETLDHNYNQKEDENNKSDNNELGSMPISHVSEVSPSFLCSTPLKGGENEKELVPVKASTVIGEDSLEVTVHERGGSCRVLKITEKEEPLALVEKRKSVRTSKKQPFRKSADENKSAERNLTDHCPELNFSDGQTECREQVLTLSDVSVDITSENICSNTSVSDQQNTNTLTDTDIPGLQNQTQNESVVENNNFGKNLPHQLSCDCAIDQKTVYPKALCQDSYKHDDVKLPVRSNIQKVSYRSVTDSDDSDDSDLKLENLPKLVIDESVFDDSDSCENENSSRDNEVAEAISDLTDKIAKELTVSEDINEPVHMTLEEVMKEEPRFTVVESADKYSNSVLFDVSQRKELEVEICPSVSQSMKSLGKMDEQKDNFQTEGNNTLENESVVRQSDKENLISGFRLHITETSELENCAVSMDVLDQLEQNISTAPPRPPPPVNIDLDQNNVPFEYRTDDDQSDCGNSGSSQSDQRSPDSETPSHKSGHPPLIFRPGSGSSQSDAAEDDSPPAIPPRVRIKKHVKEASSCYKDFMESMRQLKDVGWYWGPLIWEEAEAKLANKPEGSFLVRDSSDERYILSLSFKHQGRVHHTRIEHHRGQFSFWSQPESHGKSTIKDFIEQCVDNSRNGRFLYFIRPSAPGAPPLPIHLLHPISRFAQMRSLQHMCRFAILQMVRRDHIDELPIPTRIKKYLQEAQYYVEYLED